MKPIRGFFDDPETEWKDYHFWHRPKGKIQIQEEDIIFMAPLLRKDEDTGTIIENFFVLTLDFLFLFDSEKEQTIKAFMSTEWVRTDFLSRTEEDSTLFILRFIKNCKFYDLFTTDENHWKVWKQKLSRVYVQCDFHQKFKNLKVIGKGSYARVYLVENIETKERLAVKALRKKFLEEHQKNGSDAMKNEIQIMRRLRHPHIMQLYEVQESKNSLYLVMELLQGGELLQFVSYQDSYTLQDILNIVSDLLSTLKFMHSHKIMHRDLKPENILLLHKKPLKQNMIKIADFGLATFTDVDQFIFKRCGTPGYVAPEIIRASDSEDLRYGPKCDVFSVGVIFYILLTEKSPFEGTFAEVVKANKKCQIDFSHSALQKHPQILFLLQSMLEPNPQKRLSAEEALQNQIFTYCSEWNEEEIPTGFESFREKIQFADVNEDESCSMIIRKALINGKTESVKDSGDNLSFNSMNSPQKQTNNVKPNILKLVLTNNAQKCTHDIYEENKFVKDDFIFNHCDENTNLYNLANK